MAKCEKCNQETCSSCGTVITCTLHCYCQQVVVGSVSHRVCCKCGDRVAATVYPSVYPQPLFPYPAIPWYPSYPTYPTWSTFIYSSSGVTTSGLNNSILTIGDAPTSIVNGPQD